MLVFDDKSANYTSPRQFVKDLHAAFVRLGLSSPSAALLVTHSAVSTSFGAHMGGYRIAGIKAGPSCVCDGTCPEKTPAGNYTCLKGCEENKTTGSLRCWVMPWRAYASLDAAAADMLKLLRSPRYAAAYVYLVAGDVRYFEQVGKDGWYSSSKAADEMRAKYPTVRHYLGLPDPGVSFGGLVFLSLTVGALWRLYRRGSFF